MLALILHSKQRNTLANLAEERNWINPSLVFSLKTYVKNKKRLKKRSGQKRIRELFKY